MKNQIKIIKLIASQLTRRELAGVRAGAGVGNTCANPCVCGCQGPSTNYQNGSANMSQGKFSTGGGTLYENTN